MEDLYRELSYLLARGERVALATVVKTQGSTPQEVGTKMLIRRGGSIMGTIGGGCGEAEVRRRALEVLEGQPCSMVVDLTEEVTMETEKACGGVMQVFIDPWGQEEKRLAEELAAAVEERKPFALATVLKGAGSKVGSKLLLREKVGGSLGDPALDEWARQRAEEALVKGVPVAITHQETELFIDIYKPPPTLLIAGAGHIAIPLAEMGALLDFRVVVLDDRPTFARKERFPKAEEVIVGQFEESLKGFPIDEETNIIIITRGHRHDTECLRQVLYSSAAYIGMIGSRRRVKGVFELLRKEGYPEEKIAQVHAPIGLDIGAKTPAEIALAIMGEIIKVRHGGSGRPLSQV